ncbi:sensor histidine kinase [Desertibacillus haloalkaliphilus]|uniref:sensor histidine kinase n=1 Tax=Desertibacillus haloalkaliphilus TaxID=1328930 RepID=UPI001C279C35|nr:HAMP domain-containing sensor histidine kinase [Desertibacillus haloalkaliphilus]MBU8908024.1 HAMP domain-containing histidine kinase [Desertibacillus haloalkaliphilus]
MKKRLSTKITMIIVCLLIIVISMMIFMSYTISKTFYKNNLTEDVSHRIIAHTRVIQEHFELETIQHVLTMEEKDDVHLVLFDVDLSTVVKSNHVQDEWMVTYYDWVNEQLQTYNDYPIIDYFNTGIDFHIPHIWALQPIIVNDEIKGYLFIDQDTGQFEQTKVKLAVVLIIMGILTFTIGFLMTIYLTRKISKPLTEMGRAANQIAKGDFDNTPSITGEDEVGQLASDISLMAKQLKEYRDSRQQFISHISHDLRTPITYIKGYSAIMRDTDDIDRKDLDRNLAVIYQEATRMEHLVRDLFQLTKLEEGRVSLELETIKAVPWLYSILESRQLMFDQNSLTYEIIANDDMELTVDQHRMGQAVINLIENSIRYTVKGGKVTLKLSENDHHTIIEISDTGRGIPRDDLPHIWDRFYRVDKSRSSKSGGSGLGLAIVKQVIELHQGDVKVESVEGKGTTFFIYLLKR